MLLLEKCIGRVRKLLWVQEKNYCMYSSVYYNFNEQKIDEENDVLHKC